MPRRDVPELGVCRWCSGETLSHATVTNLHQVAGEGGFVQVRWKQWYRPVAIRSVGLKEVRQVGPSQAIDNWLHPPHRVRVLDGQAVRIHIVLNHVQVSTLFPWELGAGAPR